MPLSLFCKQCVGFVPHLFTPILESDMRLRIKSVCTYCDRSGAKIGSKALAEGTGSA